MLKINIKKMLDGENGEFLLEANTIFNSGIHVIRANSGSGKTTLLDIISGLSRANSGEIYIDNKLIYNNNTFIKPQKREISYMMQDYQLFKHKTVYKNLIFAKKDEKFANELLTLLNIYNLKNRYPTELSGGQLQRSVLAMIMMKRPKVLLIDEPTSALDSKSANSVIKLIKTMSLRYKIVTIVVTHNIKESIKLSKNIYTIENGKLIKIENHNSTIAKVSDISSDMVTLKLKNNIDLKIGDNLYIENL